MTQVQVKSGEIRNICQFKDFVELVDEFLGFDCMKYAMELHDAEEWEAAMDENIELQEKVDELEEKLKERDGD